MPWKKILACVTGEIEESLLARIEYLIEENRVLRRQVQGRPNLTDPERKLLAEKAILLGTLMADTVTMVKPATILKWHRRLVARKFDGSEHRRKTGRPPLSPRAVELILTMARENPSWDYDRIAGSLYNLGIEVSDQTVGNTLQRHGISPTPERVRNSTWHEFIRQHRETLWACDFFTSEVWTRTGLTTYYILFFIHIGTRRVVVGGITRHPNQEWVNQIARNVTGMGGELASARYLIHDRDCKFTDTFDVILDGVGISPIKLPVRSPNLNAFAERFVRSIKEECLGRMILFGERMLTHVVREYVDRFHAERNHQGIGNRIPFPDGGIEGEGEVVTSERLGGLLRYDYRDAA
jgi:transposase InsO family protein